MQLTKYFGIFAVASSLMFAGCNQQSAPAPKADAKNEPATTQTLPAETIKVGVMSGEEQTIAEVAKKVAKDKYNLTVELVTFTDYAVPNTAVSKGDLDANAMQHKPYFDKDTQSKNIKNLVIVGNTFVYPLAGYSKKIKTVAELKDEATIAIPNDPSNLARSLILLEKQGLIKLKDNKDLFATTKDIVENPKKLNIKEVEGGILVKALDDVDLAVINNNFASQAQLYANEHGIFVEEKDSPYVNIIVARDDNKDSTAVQNFIKSYQSDEVNAEAQKIFKNSVVKGW